MRNENLFESIKDNLNGRPGQPIILGVCSALAQRFNIETWIVRAATIIGGVFFTFFTLAAYIVLGFCLNETEQRTRGVFEGLRISLAEGVQKFAAGLSDIFNGSGKNRDNGYR